MNRTAANSAADTQAGVAAREILERTGSYVAVFLIAGSAYLVAWALIQVLTPRLEPVAFADTESSWPE